MAAVGWRSRLIAEEDYGGRIAVEARVPIVMHCEDPPKLPTAQTANDAAKIGGAARDVASV